ncbi:L-glutaminase [Streptoalloteichus tenebrarius]|uniref:Glutaminase n=1 Tax=Streptoalloteichus tenebrarius (strain ATCC 17920 / DSM 40477 / JCM 4838 / CBS 697.72 / NBRC 16177 / NCIMB 11028 / NRRL B-12390 / A12253. 1 / ISP 5477) TaxID=1933 RepID=A0ABT1HUG3_STRSD|nr:glutaminase [Streptoalloteichus tenebrarius]MCP2259166.1 L-glutaminase [Streptoalloteichus tenebrarius]BFF04357.1 glutaminase [Streptoalloteichus tenebrarius]
MDHLALLERIKSEVEPEIGRGRLADYIPALAEVDPNKFGFAVADLDGRVVGVGDWEEPFSLQSVAKVFALALVVARDGERIWERVGREPSGNPFNSLVQLEHEHGIPRNPFINAGALVITDRLLTLTRDARGALRDFLREESGNADVDFDAVVATSEAEHGARNAALAYFMASHDNMENPVPDVLEHYFWQSSLAMSCRDLALAGLFLARHGLRADGSRVLSSSDAKRINSIMLTCGTYDAAGEFAYRVGLPGKSGVGGGILAVMPGRGTLAVWSPCLDSRGNSVAGVAALDRFSTLTGWSVF